MKDHTHLAQIPIRVGEDLLSIMENAYDMGYKDAMDDSDWYDIPSENMTVEQLRRAVKDLRKYIADNKLEDGK